MASKYSHKRKMTKAEVTTELLRMQSEGHSMKTTEFEPWFYRRINDCFGSYKVAKCELGISTERKPYEGGRERLLSDVITETKSAVLLVANMSEMRDNYRHILDYSRTYLGDSGKIFELAGVEKPMSRERVFTPHYWTEDVIRKELAEAIRITGSSASNAISQTGYKRVVNAVTNYYGTWNAGLVALGYEVAMATPNMNWTKESVKESALNAITNGTIPNRQSLSIEITGFNNACTKLFGSYTSFKEYAGYCELSDKPNVVIERSPKLNPVDKVKREIIRMWYTGMPLNYRFVRKRRSHLLQTANNSIGSWRQAVESVGINYADITKASDTNVLSECGTEFELLFAEILTELNYEYIREGERLDEIFPDGFTLKPDFILPNWRWIDCKLSEWTDVSEMMKRYTPMEPNGISIVYLRGSKRRKERGSKWRYEHVSVYCFTEDLPEDRRKYYDDKLNEIARKAEVGAVAK